MKCPKCGSKKAIGWTPDKDGWIADKKQHRTYVCQKCYYDWDEDSLLRKR